jgi:formate dehydrogenase subunit gamma
MQRAACGARAGAATVTAREEPHPSRSGSRPERVPRFALGTRLLHWLNAIPFLALLISGLLLYFPELKVPEVGGFRLVPLLHVVFGVAWLVAPLTLVALVRRRRVLAEDVAGALTPQRGDIAWLRYASLVLLGATVRAPPTGKFNAGQKLNTWYWVLASTALAATGLVLALNFFDTTLLDTMFVQRVYPLHELIALVSIVPLAGHLYLTLINRSTRPSLPGIISGDVDGAWAREHHAVWYEDVAHED